MNLILLHACPWFYLCLNHTEVAATSSETYPVTEEFGLLQ